MRIRVLGPLEVEAGGRTSSVASAKERSLLKVLALSAGEIVSTDSLIESLWGDAPPAAARTTLQTYVQQLTASPPAARRFLRASIEADVRHLVPEVEVPALVIHATSDRAVPVARGRWLADHLPRARFVPVESDIHLMCLSDVIDAMTAEIAQFVDDLTTAQSDAGSVLT